MTITKVDIIGQDAYDTRYAIGRDPGAYWPGDEYVEELAGRPSNLPVLPVEPPPPPPSPAEIWGTPAARGWVRHTLDQLAKTYTGAVKRDGHDSADAQLILAQIAVWEGGDVPALGAEASVSYRANADDTTFTIPPVHV